MILFRRFALACVLLIAPVLASAQANQPPIAQLPDGVAPVDFQTVAMTMTTPSGAFPMLLELALTREQSQRGLMYRYDLPDDYGMLFVFGAEQPLGFWMENTPSPLDIIYIRGDGTVDSIVQGEPFSREALPSEGLARYALEIRQGLAEVYGIVPGAKIEFTPQ